MRYQLNKKLFLLPLGVLLWILSIYGLYQLSSYTSAEQNPEDHYKSGISYVQQGKYPEAMREFKEAIKLKADYADAYHSLGPLYYLQGKPEEALNSLKQAIRLRPDYAEAYNTLGSIYSAQHRVVEASRAFREALRIKPDYVEALVNLGWMDFAQGKFEEAIQELKKAKQINPDHFDTHFLLALTYHQIEQYPEALEEFKEASRIRPDHLETHQYLGSLYSLQGKHEEAIREFRKVIESGSRDATAYNDLAWLLIDKELNIDEGIELAYKALEIGSNYIGAMRTLGWGYYKKGMYEESVEWFQKALEGLPKVKSYRKVLSRLNKNLEQ